MLLSGGRDSRMLAGLLARHGRRAHAITLGRPDDIESRCAAGVARALRFPQEQVDIAPAEYPAAADRMARWEHVESGFHYCDPWALPGRMGPAPGALVSGLVMDAILGGSHIAWAHEPRTGALGFEPFFARANRLAFAPAAVEALLADGRGRDVVGSVLGEIRSTFEGLADSPARRAWCFDLYHRQRFYVGRAAWAWSFGAWPILPAVDRELLETCAALPAASLADRRLQDAILGEELPALAELPLDRNGFDSSPLRPRLRDLVLDHVRRRVRSLGLLRAPTLERDWERLYFFRTFAIQSRGWSTVRAHAEPHRERLHSVLAAAPLGRALPGPDAVIATDDMILDSARPKLLLGLILWARDHL
jgi:asparagine synthase (glutamine-hydrolysing)